MRFLVLCICAVLLSASEISLEFLESKPKGIARDFYIWQFLSNETTSNEDALKAYELIFRKTSKLDKLIANRGKVGELPRNLQCQSMKFETLKKQDKDCIKVGLNLASIPKMSQKNINFLLKTFAEDEKFKKRIEILSHPNIILTGMLKSDAATFAAIYNALSNDQRAKIINQNIKPKSLKKLADENNKAFNTMLQSIIISYDKYDKFKISLLGANITGADAYTMSLLGFNEILHNKPKNALAYFRNAANKASENTMQKNRALFWQYLLSGDSAVLQKLAKSENIDVYSIYAYQTLDIPHSYNIATEVGKISSKKPKFDIKDPFQWQLLRESIAELKKQEDLIDISKHFAFEDTSPHLAYVLNQIDGFKVNYFITPFSNKLKWRDEHQKAFTYAIAKQESTLLPALVSTSYALGMMQIMPFNVEPFAKKLGRDNVSLEDMFNPVTALEFGRFYLDDLGKEFKHPLFVSYAYNGGPSFLRKILKSKLFFVKSRKYEPWLSMELIPYRESRDYGLRVMANYIIYQATFGHNVNLQSYLEQTLIN